MKKLFVPVLLMLCLVLLSGCGGAKQDAASPSETEVQAATEETQEPFFLGTWIARTAVLNGETVDAKDVMGGTFLLIFLDSGECTMAIDDQYATVDWTYNDDGTITLTGDSSTYEISFPDGSEDTMLAVIKGVEITMEKMSE